ncbi:response regulator [Foetidibacter luteolus]|uniref:response regulator n=1 Tax=Foetidibacter luteolus TaxID=2608880 RepID=UPI00129BF4DE|nr:response regulator [Foetidibacter luteolus]
MKNPWRILFFLIFSAVLFSCKRHADEAPLAKKGILDLTGANLGLRPLQLDGEWEFYYNKLLGPADSSKATSYTNFPALWKEIKVNGKSLPSQGYASYRLTVLLPKSRPVLAIEIPDTYTAYRLFVNGRLYAQSGVPDTTKALTKPHWLTNVAPFGRNIRDTLHLLLQVSNFHHSKGGLYKHVLIGERQTLMLKRDRRLTGDFLLSGCLFMGGLFFLGLYFFGRHDKAILYFALFCIVYCYRIVGVSPYSLHTILPELSWQLTIRLEYISLSLSVFLFVGYIKHLYPDDIYKPFFPFMSAFALFFTVLPIVTAPVFFTGLINIFLGAMFFYIAYAIYLFIKAAANKRMGASYALMSTGVIMAVFIIINLNYLVLVEFPYYLAVYLGYICFFFCQSLILSFRFAQALKQAKLQAEQGLRAKSEFLSTMSHEIRTPLNSVIGTANLMLQSSPTTTQKEYLDVLLFSANNLVAIVNDILDYNKIEAGKIVFESIEMDIAAIAKNIIAGAKTSATDKGIELRIETDPALKNKVYGDPTRTSQVIYNLVNNAIKFTNEGWVCLRIKIKQQAEQNIAILFEVEDTGIGIEAAKQKLIFEKFTQADSSTSRGYGGTGLGLAICKRLLELQNSNLRLRSLPGVGSVFYFTQVFPLGSAIEDVKKAVVKTARKDATLDGINILLVEDNQMNIFIARKMLAHWQANVDVAENGKIAVEKAAGKEYDILLMDLHMPVMDGYTATRQLRENGCSVPVVALTAAIPSEVEEKVFEAGMNTILIKPYSSNELLNVILREVGNVKQES